MIADASTTPKGLRRYCNGVNQPSGSMDLHRLDCRNPHIPLVVASVVTRLSRTGTQHFTAKFLRVKFSTRSKSPYTLRFLTATHRTQMSSQGTTFCCPGVGATVDVYRGTHAVVFIFDVTRPGPQTAGLQRAEGAEPRDRSENG